MGTMHQITSGSTYPAPITAMRIAGALSVPDILSDLLARKVAIQCCLWTRRMVCVTINVVPRPLLLHLHGKRVAPARFIQSTY
jgi:hypothetical protein